MEHSEVIADAEAILTRRYGGAQKLTEPARLQGSGFAEVYRARVASNPFVQHRSVVVKHSPLTGDPLEDAAYLREVVAYQFTTSLHESVRPGPTLLGYDPDKRIIIITDSGEGESLDTLLTDPDSDSRKSVLRKLGLALGRMHAGTADKENEFNALFSRMTRAQAGTAEIQTLRDRLLVHRIRLGVQMLQKAHISVPAEVIATAANIRTRVLRGGNRAFTPFDLAPDNIIFASTAQFLDYEWAGFRDVAFDLASVIAGFPNYVSTTPISDEEAQVLIDAWVGEVEKVWPAVRNADTLYARITAAMIGWALSSIAILNVNEYEQVWQQDPAVIKEFEAAGLDVSDGAQIEDFQVSGDLLRPSALGPFTQDETLARRDLFETFEALSRYAGTGEDPAYQVISDFARGVAQRLV